MPDDGPATYRYGPMCWRCRGFYARLRLVGSEWLCNYCAFWVTTR